MLSVLALETAGLSLLRADPAPLVLGLRLETLAWAGLGLLFALVSWLFSKSIRNAAPVSPDQAA
jgi:hypothetical protein